MEGGRRPVRSFEDLDVYQKLLSLHLEIHVLSMSFPHHELYELGSQLRRSSNAVPAILAEAWNNKHLNVYLEGINRAIGELNETRHHLSVANRKGYLTPAELEGFTNRYEESRRMLNALGRSLERSRVQRRR